MVDDSSPAVRATEMALASSSQNSQHNRDQRLDHNPTYPPTSTPKPTTPKSTPAQSIATPRTLEAIDKHALSSKQLKSANPITLGGGKIANDTHHIPTSTPNTTSVTSKTHTPNTTSKTPKTTPESNNISEPSKTTPESNNTSRTTTSKTYTPNTTSEITTPKTSKTHTPNTTSVTTTPKTHTPESINTSETTTAEANTTSKTTPGSNNTSEITTPEANTTSKTTPGSNNTSETTTPETNTTSESTTSESYTPKSNATTPDTNTTSGDKSTALKSNTAETNTTSKPYTPDKSTTSDNNMNTTSDNLKTSDKSTSKSYTPDKSTKFTESSPFTDSSPTKPTLPHKTVHLPRHADTTYEDDDSETNNNTTNNASTFFDEKNDADKGYFTSVPLSNSFSDVSPSPSNNATKSDPKIQQSSVDTPQRRNSYTYNSSPTSQTDNSNPIPMSMRFMHKPSRAKELFDKANDPTKANSLLNSQISYSLDSKIAGDDKDIDQDTTSVDSQSPDPSNSPPQHPSTQYHQLVRKKSGEILKSSLKDASQGSYYKQRARSEPTTPTYKQVHFGGDTDVKYFKKKDKPNAISASNSPTLSHSDYLMDNTDNYSDDDYDDEAVEDYEDDDVDDQLGSRIFRRTNSGSAKNNVDDAYGHYIDEELNTHSDDSGGDYHNFDLNNSSTNITKYPNPRHAPLINWELFLPNFPVTNYLSKLQQLQLPVFLERVFITVDKKYLLGQIAVKNFCYHKSVNVRYSSDNWKSITEIPTIYVPDVPPILKLNNYDRFVFKIQLGTIFNSYSMVHNAKRSNQRVQENSYDLCIRYIADTAEYWDNNNSQNYNIKLVKRISLHSDDTRQQQQPQKRLASTNPNTFKPPAPTTKIQDHDSKPKYSSSFLRRRVSDSEIPTSAKAKGRQQEQFNDENSESSNTTPKGRNIYAHDNDSSDFNDFIKNGYYMSSPMLSSYHARDVEGDLGISSSNKSDSQSYSRTRGSPSLSSGSFRPPLTYRNQSINRPPSNIEAGKLGDSELDPKDSPPNTNSSSSDVPGTPVLNSLDNQADSRSDAAPGPDRPFKSNFLNSKSYKELLDSYCFFATPRNIGASESASSPSPESDNGYWGAQTRPTNGHRNNRGRDNDTVSTVSTFLN